jgi:succinate-semialdehyde dehydrogenase/glutarate-semialdehyde dehydrogenase
MFIGGHWVQSEDGKTFLARNPATGDAIAEVPLGTRADARKAAEAARAAQSAMRRMSTWDRSHLCLRIADVIHGHEEELARTVSLEQGKPYHSEALPEVRSVARMFAEAAELVKWLEGNTIPVEDARKRAFTIRQPRGVYAIVTPWNFPMEVPTEYLAPGLAAGNAIVWVPAPTTAACAVALARCFEEAEVPPGALNLVTGEGPVVGDEIVASPLTDAVGFTGSSKTGETIAGRAAGKPLLLELGGNGPTIVFADANLDAAAEAIASGCFSNAGQICSATERILVERSVARELATRLVDRARQIRLGNPLERSTQMGPLNNEATAAKMDRHLQDARDKGATVLVGGERRPEFGSNLFYAPAVVLDVPPDSAMFKEESFGPLAALTPFDTEEEAMQLADGDPLGLVSAVWTSRMGRAMRCAERLRTGIVNINSESTYWETHLPFGGAPGKHSGIGRLGGRYTLMEMTTLKTITFDIQLD